jgi:hypothetical protein
VKPAHLIGEDSRNYHVNQLVSDEIVHMLIAQWEKANAVFIVPVIDLVANQKMLTTKKSLLLLTILWD